MYTYKHIFTYGFALFAMFFGSGNLVFPLQIGQNSGTGWPFGFLGLFFTGIALPFLGLFVIKLHKGSYDSFFAEGGPIARFALPLFTLSLLGAFGVIPRCITVAHGGMEYIWPALPLWFFSAVFCILTYYFCLKDQRMMNALGKWMSPLLLAALFILIGAGIWAANPQDMSQNLSISSFADGFITGYQTMDLFAAFFFAALVFAQVQQLIPSATHRETIRFAIKPSIIGASLLAIIYLGFVFLGSHYPDITEGVAPEYLLPTIAQHVMGDQATFFIGVAMLFSCLTTAVALNNIYARYLVGLLRISEQRFPYVLLGTTGISFILSLLDFKGIASFLAPALEVSYPGIIWLTLLSIFSNGWKTTKKAGFYLITAYMIIQSIL